jgi:hypothetical protein
MHQPCVSFDALLGCILTPKIRIACLQGLPRRLSPALIGLASWGYDLMDCTIAIANVDALTGPDTYRSALGVLRISDHRKAPRQYFRQREPHVIQGRTNRTTTNIPGEFHVWLFVHLSVITRRTFGSDTHGKPQNRPSSIMPMLMLTASIAWCSDSWPFHMFTCLCESGTVVETTS